MIQVETTLTLKRFDTYERLDEQVNQFIKNHNVISVERFQHKCNNCDGDIGYSIIYEIGEIANETE